MVIKRHLWGQGCSAAVTYRGNRHSRTHSLKKESQRVLGCSAAVTVCGNGHLRTRSLKKGIQGYWAASQLSQIVVMVTQVRVCCHSRPQLLKKRTKVGTGLLRSGHRSCFLSLKVGLVKDGHKGKLCCSAAVTYCGNCLSRLH